MSSSSVLIVLSALILAAALARLLLLGPIALIVRVAWGRDVPPPRA